MIRRKPLIFVTLVLGIIAILAGCSSVKTAETAGTAQALTDSSSQAVTNSIEYARLLGNGINLGNTMEAYGHVNPGIDQPVSAYETLWGQPVTTAQMLVAMKKSGFDSIRIPVAWTNTMDFEHDNFTIAEAYLDRVQEIVDYALAADMRVIINDHWDGAWWGMFGSSNAQTRAKGMTLYKAIWTQVGMRFKDYPDTLVFESANEELGNRLNETFLVKDSGSLKLSECYQVTNTINQSFVDLIRSQGGNNAERFLLIAGFDTSIFLSSDPRFIMPKDSASDRLMVSVHYYDPWSYCGADTAKQWGNSDEYYTMNDALSTMKKFTELGYGVVIGEYGVLPLANGALKADIVSYHKNLLDVCDLYGYAPMLWDCSSFFIRSELKIKDEGLAELYKSRNLAKEASLSREELVQQAKTALENSLAQAKKKAEKEVSLTGNGKAIAWIMYTSSDWSMNYSVGDVYNPANSTAGILASDVEITGPGTYTVSLDFSATASGAGNGMTFSALAIANGELLFPGYYIEIKKVEINGNPYTLQGIPYTTTDDKQCTRSNLYNSWVARLPRGFRSLEKDKSKLSAQVIDNESYEAIKKISVTFEYKAP